MQGKDPYLALLGFVILGAVFLFCGERPVKSPPPVASGKPADISPPTQNIVESPVPSPPPVAPVSGTATLKKKIDELLMGTTMLFRSNSALLVPEGKAVLNSVAVILQEDPTTLVEVVAQTESVGPEQANRLLSEQRAKAVVEYLISRGVVADRLTPKGYGASQPITESSTAEARQQNRQIEFSVGAGGEQP